MKHDIETFIIFVVFIYLFIFVCFIFALKYTII